MWADSGATPVVAFLAPPAATTHPSTMATTALETGRIAPAGRRAAVSRSGRSALPPVAGSGQEAPLVPVLLSDSAGAGDSALTTCKMFRGRVSLPLLLATLLI